MLTKVISLIQTYAYEITDNEDNFHQYRTISLYTHIHMSPRSESNRTARKHKLNTKFGQEDLEGKDTHSF